MKDASLNKILLAAVAILALGQAYLMYQVSGLRQPFPSIASIPMPSGSYDPSGAPSGVVPVPPSSMLSPVVGVVQSVAGSRMSLLNGSTTVIVTIDPDTVIVELGTRKDSAQYAAEMEAFRESSMTLSQDPKKNMSALQILIAPSHFKEATAALSDITAGRYVNALCFIKDGVLHANKVTLSSPGPRPSL